MVDLSPEELQRKVDSICLGQTIRFVKNKDGEDVPVLFKHPSPIYNQMADFYYKRCLKEAIEEGLPTLDNLKKTVEERNLFTQRDKDKLEELENKLKGQEFLLMKTTKIPANRDRIKGNIKRIKDDIAKIKYKKEKIYSLSAERKAGEFKLHYLTWLGTYRPENADKRFWGEYEEFLNEKDFLFRETCFLEYVLFFHGIDVSTMRFIARSTYWRIIYVTALKTGESVFGRPIGEYTIDQKSVMYWSHYYQSIYEMPGDDRPPPDIIEDDDALDAYMKDWQRERNQETAARKGTKNKHGKQTAWNHGETLVFDSNPMKKDIQYSDTLANKAKHKGQNTVDAAPTHRKKGKRKR